VTIVEPRGRSTRIVRVDLPLARRGHQASRDDVARACREHVCGIEWDRQRQEPASSALPTHLLLLEGRPASHQRRVPRHGRRLHDCVWLPPEVGRSTLAAVPLHRTICRTSDDRVRASLAASVLQAPGFPSDVGVFRLNSTTVRQSGLEPAFRRNTAERVYLTEAAPNPEVAGSNPAPATHGGPGDRGVSRRLSLWPAAICKRFAGGMSDSFRSRASFLSRARTALSVAAEELGRPVGSVRDVQPEQRLTCCVTACNEKELTSLWSVRSSAK
jgi:hypothetical protein